MEVDDKIKTAFPSVVRCQFEALGADIDVRIIVKSEDQKIAAEKNIREIKKLYAEFSMMFSRFEQGSELSKLNLALGRFNIVSPHMSKLVSLCLNYYKKTYGLYDPRILDVLEKVGYSNDFKRGVRRMAKKDDVAEKKVIFEKNLADDLKIDKDKVFFGVRMDFSGIAKGYITDRIADFLFGQGWKNFLVDSGGDEFICGVDEDGKKWTVGVEGIEEKKVVFVLDNKGIATSGASRRKWEIEGKRFHHIINPKDPDSFSFDLKSVSVIAESAVEADVLAKTIFLKGKTDGILHAKENGLAVVVLDCRGSAWISSEAKKYLYQ